MTPIRQDLLKALSQIQNHPAFEHQDIMTFTGFMDDEEVRKHIEANMAFVATWNFEEAQKQKMQRKRRKAA